MNEIELSALPRGVGDRSLDIRDGLHIARGLFTLHAALSAVVKTLPETVLGGDARKMAVEALERSESATKKLLEQLEQKVKS